MQGVPPSEIASREGIPQSNIRPIASKALWLCNFAWIKHRDGKMPSSAAMPAFRQDIEPRMDEYLSSIGLTRSGLYE